MAFYRLHVTARANASRYRQLITADAKERAVLTFVVAVYIVVFLYRLWQPQFAEGHQYSSEAASLLRGHLDIVAGPRITEDIVIAHGHTYLPVPFLPALLLVPAVWLFGYGPYEGLAAPAIGILNLLLIQVVLRRAHCSPSLRPWLLLLFGVGTLHFSAVAIGGNWLLSHVLTTTFLLALLIEAFGRGRGTLMGLAVGLASLCRPSAIAVLPFCLLAGWARGRRGNALVSHSIQVLGGLLPAVAGWLWYDWARFGSPLSTGYQATVVPRCLAVTQRTHGTFSLAYIPKNLYIMLISPPVPVVRAATIGGAGVVRHCANASTALLSAPVLTPPWIQPSEWGMGLIFTTPALLYAITTFAWRPWSFVAAITILTSAVAILTYYSSGWIQFGYRYSMDFLPFVMLLLALNLPTPPSKLFRSLVILSCLVELWGMAFFLPLSSGITS